MECLTDGVDQIHGRGPHDVSLIPVHDGGLNRGTMDALRVGNCVGGCPLGRTSGWPGAEPRRWAVSSVWILIRFEGPFSGRECSDSPAGSG